MKLLVFTFIFLTLQIIGNSQTKTKIVLKYGFNYPSLSSVSGNENINIYNGYEYKTKAGLIISAEFEILIMKNLALCPGIIYTDRNIDLKARTSINYDREKKLNYKYISVPLTAKFFIPFNTLNLYMYGGSILSFLISAEEDYTIRSGFGISRDVFSIDKETNPNDFGFVIGNGIEINLISNIACVFSAEYFFSIVNYLKSDTMQDYVRALNFNFGFSIEI